MFSMVILSLIGFVLYDILARQLGLYTMWAFDVSWFHFAFLIACALAYSLFTGSCVSVDLISKRYPLRTQHIIQFVGFGLFAVPITVLFIWLAWGWAMDSWAIKELTNSASRIPVYPIKAFLPIGLLLSLPQLMVLTIRHGYFAIRNTEL